MSTAAKFTITADQITDVAPVFFNAKRVPLFVGKPGMAKTAFVREAANALSRNRLLKKMARECAGLLSCEPGKHQLR